MSIEHTAVGNTARGPHPADGLPGGLPWEPRADDLGLQIVDTIGHCLTLDAEWSVRDERGFTWWGKDLAQRVWSEPGFDDDGFEIFRLHARTDLLTGFDPCPGNLARLNLLGGLTTTSGFLIDEEAGTVRVAASMYAHAETEDWARRTFQLVVAMQAAEAQLQAGLLAKVTGATVAASAHPISGARPVADEMLGVLEFVAGRGDAPSAWEGEELEWTTAVVQSGRHTVAATGDATGLSAEFPFQSRTSLLTVTTKASRPELGNGVLLLLHLPMNIGETDGIEFATELNRRELDAPTRSHFLGSWHWRDDGLHFVTFLPNAIHVARGSLLNVVMCSAARAKWVAETFYGDDWDANREHDESLATPAALDLASPLFRNLDQV